MNEIVFKKEIAPKTVLLRVQAPGIAAKIKPGQFVIVRISEQGERIPLSYAGADASEGILRLVVQAVGRTTTDLTGLETGQTIKDIIGPLGHPTPVAHYGTCVLIGGGYGAGALVPVAESLKQEGNKIIAIIGGRTGSLVVMEDEIRPFCNRLIITTDDGSEGKKGLVTDALKEVMSEEKINFVMAVGPVPMMKAVSEMTRSSAIKTLVSLNALMVDGTGMCGACRVSVGGQTRFACVDGPDFDGHQVDFELLTQRLKMYRLQEEEIMKRSR